MCVKYNFSIFCNVYNQSPTDLYLESPARKWCGLSIQGLCVWTKARQTCFPIIDKSHCDKHHSSSTNGLTVYVEKQPVAWKECCVEYWCAKARKHMSRWTGCRDITGRRDMIFFQKCLLSSVQKSTCSNWLILFQIQYHIWCLHWKQLIKMFLRKIYLEMGNFKTTFLIYARHNNCFSQTFLLKRRTKERPMSEYSMMYRQYTLLYIVFNCFTIM